VVDKHMEILARQHVETKFIKVTGAPRPDCPCAWTHHCTVPGGAWGCRGALASPSLLAAASQGAAWPSGAPAAELVKSPLLPPCCQRCCPHAAAVHVGAVLLACLLACLINPSARARPAADQRGEEPLPDGAAARVDAAHARAGQAGQDRGLRRRLCRPGQLRRLPHRRAGRQVAPARARSEHAAPHPRTQLEGGAPQASCHTCRTGRCWQDRGWVFQLDIVNERCTARRAPHDGRHAAPPGWRRRACSQRRPVSTAAPGGGRAAARPPRSARCGTAAAELTPTRTPILSDGARRSSELYDGL